MLPKYGLENFYDQKCDILNKQKDTATQTHARAHTYIHIYTHNRERERDRERYREREWKRYTQTEGRTGRNVKPVGPKNLIMISATLQAMTIGGPIA